MTPKFLPLSLHVTFMNISYNWLCQYINSGLKAREAADLLTSCGLEVEGIELFETVKGGLKGLVVGEVIETVSHPNADRLTVCKVNIGSNELSQIVCGAPNVAAGQKVIVALPGTTIYPLSGDPFEIKKSKIRGEASEGMICAEDEIGLGESHEGILVLNNATVPGASVAEYFKLETDNIFSIGLTPNRSDAASHIGVARDLAAVINTRIPNSKVNVNWPAESLLTIPERSPEIAVEVKDDDCIRYSGVHISGIKVTASPSWLSDRLRSVGLKPINNIVDITNFVLYEMGQPLHAFDAGKIAGRKVIVQKLPAKTKFRTLDNEERTLNGSELMICDTNGGMCIAGIFGGLNSGVTSDTTELFLESATFDPVSVRKSSRLHGLKTDASFRFERGTDPNITVKALKRAATLIIELAGGAVSSQLVDIYPKPVADTDIDYSLESFSALTGVSMEAMQLKGILDSLDIRNELSSNGTFKLHIPPYRVDVKRAADVSEEVLRIYGYDRIPLNEKINAPLPPTPLVPLEKVRNKIAALLIAKGFTEVMCNSLTRSSVLGFYEVPPVAARIKNPLSSELDILRPHMLFPLLDMASYNTNRKSNTIRGFEFGKVYNATEEGYAEFNKLAIILTGTRQPEHWKVKDEPWNIYFMKSLLENIMDVAGTDSSRWKWDTIGTDPLLSQQVVMRVKKRVLGVTGTVSKKIVKAFDLKGDVFYAEMDLEVLGQLLLIAPPVINEPPRFPEVRRDLSMLLDKKVSYSAIEALAFETERKILRHVNLFDVYQGDKIETGKKSYALSFYLRDDDKTLTDKDIDKVMNRLMESFEKRLEAVIRKA